MTWLPRTLGVLTAVYGLSTLVRPAIFAKPAGLMSTAKGGGDEPPAPVGILVRAVGVRDLANGVAMAAAPAGPALQLAAAARVAADLGDAIVFAVSPNDDPAARRKAVAVGVAWGALNVIGVVAAGRR